MKQRKRVYEDVIAGLETRIEREKLGPGDRLPSAEDLANELSVSTRSVREAYMSLRATGLVEFKHGKGVYLLENSLEHYLESLATSLHFTFNEEKELLLQLTYTRKLIETGVIEDVAVAPPGTLTTQLDDIVESMKRALDEENLELYNELDRSFHETIVLASSNRIIGSLYMHLSQLLRESIEVTQYYGGRLKESQAEHEAMVRHIESREPLKARETMMSHLNRTHATLSAIPASEIKMHGNRLSRTSSDGSASIERNRK